MTWKIHIRIRIDKFQSGLPVGCGSGSSMVMGLIPVGAGAGGEGLGAILKCGFTVDVGFKKRSHFLCVEG